MRNSEETKKYIIEIAAPVFNKYGYVGASLNDILKHTNLTKGAIYHHFENKDNLALAALEYNLRLVSDNNFTVVKEKAHACDKLTVFAEVFIKNYDFMKQMGGCPIINAAIDSDDVNELIKNRVCCFIRAWKKSLKEILDQGRLKSEIRSDVDTETFSMNFISLIEGSLAMSKVSDDRKFLENAVRLIKSLVEEIRI